MLRAVCAVLGCRRDASCWVLAVTAPAVLSAGLEKAVHLAGSVSDQSFTIAAAVFTAEAFALRGGDAARNGARLRLLPAAVCGAMLEPLS